MWTIKYTHCEKARTVKYVCYKEAQPGPPDLMDSAPRTSIHSELSPARDKGTGAATDPPFSSSVAYCK